MAAAVVKFDTLADAVWTTTQDNHFVTVRWTCLAFHFAHHWGLVCGIHIRRLRFELSSTCVDAFEAGLNAKVVACATYVVFRAARQVAKARVGKAHHLEVAQAFLSEW